MRNAKYPCVCRRTKLPGRGVLNEKVIEVGRDGSGKKLLQMVAVCSLFLFRPVTNEELEEEVAHDPVCVP